MLWLLFVQLVFTARAMARHTSESKTIATYFIKVGVVFSGQLVVQLEPWLCKTITSMFYQSGCGLKNRARIPPPAKYPV